MYPTFSLGLGSGGEDVYLVGENLIEGTNVDASPATLTIPAGSQVGDFAIMTWRSTSTTGDLSLTSHNAILAAGWVPWSAKPNGDNTSNPTSWDAIVGDETFYHTVSWFKFLDADDLTGVSIAVTNASYKFSAMMLTFRNVHPTCPMINRRDFGNNVTSYGKTVGAPLRFHDARNRVLLFHSSEDDSIVSDMYSEINPTPEDVGGDYGVSGIFGWGIRYGVYAPDLTRASYNLITGDVFGFPVKASWNLVGCGSIQNYTESNAGTGHWRPIETADNSMHYAYREVELVAGQKYTIVLRSNSGSSNRYCWASVYDGTTEKCAFTSLWGADTIVNGEGSLEPFDHVVTLFGSGSYIAASQAYNNTIICMFTAEVTGTHQIRLGRASARTEAGRTYTGSTSQGMYILNFALVPGWGIPEVYDWAENTPPTDYPFSMNGPIVSTMNGSERSFAFTIELLHKNAQVPAQRINAWSINSHADHWPHLDKDETIAGLAWNTDAVYFAGGNNGAAKGFSNIAAHYRGMVPLYPNSIDPSVPTKAYFEYTYVAANSSALDPANVGVGVVNMGSFVMHYGSMGEASDSSRFVYGTDRNMETYGMFHSGFTVMNYDGADLRGNLAVGEVIGIAIDRDTMEVKVYVNGVLIDTGTMDRVAALDAVFAHDHGGPNGQVAFNFTGPFSYLPSGYSAWDYRNAA